MKNTDIFRELGGLDPDLVMKAAPPEASRVTAPKKSFAVYKRLIACAASFALVIGLFALVGFDNVYASIQNIFSFIPGIGIEAAGNTVYVYEPAGDSIEHEGKRAELLVASFKDGELTVIMSSSGLPLMGEDVRLTRNGDELAVAKALPFVSPESGIIELTYEISTPEKSDLFEIGIEGFEQKLSFSMTPCDNYAELEQIGPTVLHNGISVTVTAKRVGNKLIVWYYDTKTADAAADSIISFGPTWGSPDNENIKYIETESGKIYPQIFGWNIVNRDSFMLSDGDTTAVLHLPLISMARKEEAHLNTDIPEDYGIFDCDSFVMTTLGKIKITQIERAENPNNKETDIIRLKLGYEDGAENIDISSFTFDNFKTNEGYTCAYCAGDETGRTGYLEIAAPKNADKLSFDITSIEYYLTDEYIFELDID